MVAYKAADFLGLMPAIDPRQSDKFFALSGKNYIFDSLGPKSVFGNRYLTPYPLGRPQFTQSFRLKLRGGDRVFHCSGDAILEWREDFGGWRVIYLTGDTVTQPYRWTTAYLNGVMYFCNPSTGILCYVLDLDQCFPLVSEGAPDLPIAICQNNGRICAIDDTYFKWSGPGNGQDWIPRLGGAGFQVIADRLAGDPVMLTAYARGTMTWTSGGVMRSEFTADAMVYRHRALNTEYRLINSFCSFQQDDDTTVILDERGLFKTSGENPQPLTPIFNEFLIKWLQKNDLKLENNCRLEWDELQRFLYVSVSLSQYDPLYEKAFVLYPPLDKWGEFNESHYGIGPVLVKESERSDDYYGFVDSTGRVRYWLETGSREILPTEPTLESHYPLIQKPAAGVVYEPGVLLSSSMVINTVPTTQYIGPAGFSEYGSFIQAPATLTSLDAVVQMGLFRLQPEQTYDRMMEVTNLFVANVYSGNKDILNLDYNLIPDGTSDEDYNVETGSEDFGPGDSNYVNHKIRLIGTNDGYSLYMSTVPELILFNQSGRHYSCACVGLWHILELKADEVGEAFHLRVFELTAVDGGRVT